MLRKKFLSVLAAVAFAMLGLVIGLQVARADTPDREIPAIEVTSPSAGTIQVTWETPSDTDTLDSYRVSWALWATDGFTTYTAANSDTGGNAYPDASSYTITGLAPGEYAVFVRSRYDDYRNGPFKKSAKVTVASSTPVEPRSEPTPEATEEATPEPTPEPTPEATPEPGAIAGLTMTSSRPGHLWVSWDEASPAPTEYRLNWAPVGESFPAWNSRDGGNLWLPSRTAQDFSNLVDRGVTYKLRMRAIYKTGPNAPWSGPWSAVVTKRVRNNTPGAPTGLGVDSATHDGVALSWSAPGHNGLTGYRILRGSSADSLTTLVEDTGDLELTYTDTTAADDATHHYAVVALSLDGDSPQSGTVSATTPTRTTDAPVNVGAPAAPAALTAQLDGSGGVTLSWTDPDDDGITDYRIQRGDDALSMRAIVEDTGSATVGYTDATAAVNSAHVYAVQARNATGLSQLSDTVSITTLAAPTNLLLVASSDSGVTLSWTAPDSSAVTGYRILRGPSADALTTLVVDTGGTATSHADGAAAADTTYHYAVSALSTDGEGPRSDTASVTVPPAPQLTVPRDPIVIIDDDTQDPIVIVDDEPLVSAPQSEATTFISNFGTSTNVASVQNTSTGIVTLAQTFKTGKHPSGYLLDRIKFAANKHPVSSLGTPDPVFTVNTMDGGNPGTVLYTLMAPDNFVSDLSTLISEYFLSAPDGAVLQPSTTYAVVFAANSGGYSINHQSVSYLDSDAEPGWELPTSAHSIGPTLGAAWTLTPIVGSPYKVKIAILGEQLLSVSEPAGEDYPGHYRQMRTTAGIVAPGQIATGNLTAAEDDVPAGSNLVTGFRGDYFRLDVEPGRQYRLQAFFKDEAGGSVSLATGGSIGLDVYDIATGRQAGLSPGADHNRDDGVTIVHFGAGAGEEYYVHVSAYDLFNGAKSRSYHGKYHLQLTDITGVTQLLNNLWVSTSRPTDRTVGDTSWGQFIRTGNHEAGYKIDRLEVWLENVRSGTVPVVTIRNTEGSPSKPGTTVCTFATLHGFASGILPDGNDVMDILYPNEACKDVTLAKATSYWLVFGEDGHDRNYKVPNVATTSVASGPDGWQATGTLRYSDEDATTPSWTLNNGYHFLFRLWGTPN